LTRATIYPANAGNWLISQQPDLVDERVALRVGLQAFELLHQGAILTAGRLHGKCQSFSAGLHRCKRLAGGGAQPDL
jgi:hypothetical protein